eukprot:Skav206194  [mRNA]  locus=scaffold1844:229092:238304:- [translate_table: standard]
MSLKAKLQNRELKCIRDEKKRKLDQINESLEETQKDLEEQQCMLIKAALDSGSVCPGNESDEPFPSLLRPQALADCATKKDLFHPLPITHGGDADQQMMVLYDGSQGSQDDKLVKLCSEQQVVRCVEGLCKSGSGLHGLGDNKFGISEKLLSYMMENVQGFIQSSHNQFVANHGSVCEKTSECFDQLVEADDDIEVPRSCEHLCGRYCRNQIRDAELFVHASELVKSIARCMAKKRCVKLGKQMFLSPSPDTYFPVLFIETADPQCFHARLAFRISFSPLEVDFIHCSVTEEKPGTFKLELQVQEFPNSSNLSFVIDRATEFAVWFSLNYELGWKCKLFMEYDIVIEPSLHLLLTPGHGSLESTSSGGIGFESESSVLPDITADTAAKDEKQAFSYLNQLLKRFDPKPEHSKQAPRTQKDDCPNQTRKRTKATAKSKASMPTPKGSKPAKASAKAKQDENPFKGPQSRDHDQSVLGSFFRVKEETTAGNENDTGVTSSGSGTAASHPTSATQAEESAPMTQTLEDRSS